ncbi:hypothetical protein H312_01647 [Anncaliia algerae PRA339]|uniref:ISXO2-like transposase domain-containing protein n=1 Tax=Anncaliia algerae PRA339 TaxID=1288291 RepID=A0A059F1P7_9MICR|nr:hypothetical protein H312_01647 [Anncaliia algerae PRA339]
MDFFGFPRAETLYIIIRVAFIKEILYLKSFYLSFFNHLNHQSAFDLLSLRSSLPFMSSLYSTNRFTCGSNLEESLFKRKYNIGGKVRKIWIVGGIDIRTRDKFFVEVITRNASILEQSIFDYIKPGTTIYTDLWKGYINLKVRFYTLDYKSYL